MNNTQESDFTRLLELAEAVDVALMIRIAQRVLEARRKHPEFAFGPRDGFQFVKSEMLEFEAQAMLVHRFLKVFDAERKHKSNEEALDLIATLIRWIKCEFE
jgi:hypothetical protein